MYSQLTGVLIPCARLLSFKQSISVIERNRAPTGKKRLSRGRYVAVLSPRPIFERRARPPLLTPPHEFASVGPSSVAEQCSSQGLRVDEGRANTDRDGGATKRAR